MTNLSLKAFGWNDHFEDQLAPDSHENTIVVRVSAHHGTQVVVLGETGEFRVPVQSVEAAGKVAVGDWVLLKAEDHRAIKILQRKTVISRKAAGEEVKSQIIAVNIDSVFIVSSCNEDFSLARIERYLAMTMQTGAVPVVVLTKSDLNHNPDELVRQVEQLHPGLDVAVMDARDPDQAGVLGKWCGPGQSVALVGSSGVGKSTLANALGAGDLATGGIREKDGKGRHTTTSRSLHLLPTGGVLVDNPGVREFQLPDCEDGVIDLFDDVVTIIAECKFSDCKHAGEPGCAIRAAIDSGDLDERRYTSYEKLNAEQARNAKTLAARRERERKTTRTIKSAVAKKRKHRDGS
jgi:ribosome biogenesis GTPase